MTRCDNFVTFHFPSKSSNEGFARAAAACFVAQLDPTLDELNDVKTVISEGVTNAIVHGYPHSIGKIAIKLKLLEGNILEISIQDWGSRISEKGWAAKHLRLIMPSYQFLCFYF